MRVSLVQPNSKIIPNSALLSKVTTTKVKAMITECADQIAVVYVVKKATRATKNHG